MLLQANGFLLLGALLTALAGVLHFACIFWGARGFQVLGAGEQLVAMAARRHWYPPVVACAIGCVLLLWALLTLSAAGLGPQLALAKWAVLLITLVYLGRALAFPWLKRVIIGNSERFWHLSSLPCLGLAVLHGVGLAQVWQAA